MKRILYLSLFGALTLTGHAAFAADTCAKLTVTGHPQYPVIMYKDGDRIAGLASILVEAIAKQLKIPVESKYMGSWEDAQAATREGKADVIVGIYFNDERAAYLDYVRPFYIIDPWVSIFMAKGRSFPYSGQQDLIGKKGVTNRGESYGTEFDAFIKEKLTVARSDGIDDAFKDLLSGKADYLIASYYPALAEAGILNIAQQIESVYPPLLDAEMFVAFSKQSPCRYLARDFGQAMAAIKTDGRFNQMLTHAIVGWDELDHP